MNYPQQSNGPQSITEKAEFLNGLREMAQIIQQIVQKDELTIKQLYGINGTMAAQKLNLGQDHMSLKGLIDKEYPLQITSPNGSKLVLIVKVKSSGSMGGSQSYDVSIEGLICRNPNDNGQGYVMRYNSGSSMVTINDYSSTALLGSIILQEYDNNFSTQDVVSNQNNLHFQYEEKGGLLKGKASYDLQRSNIEFTFRSIQDLENIQKAIAKVKSDIFASAPIAGGSSADLAALFN